MILHADADAFFASVEQRDDPRLRGRPMVVAHEVVACPSYEARALGIHAGMPLGQVRRRWPQVLVTGYRPEAYEAASAGLFEVFRRFTPLVEPGSIEEAFLDVEGRDRGDPGAWPSRCARRAAARWACPCRSGWVAPSSWPSSRAAGPSPTDSSSSTPSSRRGCVRACVSTSSGASAPTTWGRLHAAGLLVVADLRGWSEDDLKRIVSTAMARRLLAIADGTDDATIRLPGPRRSVSASRSLPPTRTRSKVVAVLDECVGRALHRVVALEGPARLPSRLEVLVRYDDGTHVQQRGRLPHRASTPRSSAGPRLRCSSRRPTSGTDAGSRWSG